jgi:glycosyltransferase involved in cell wall biosynthesis
MRRASHTVEKDRTTSRPLVSIIVTSYNYEKYIGQTIQSILSQTYTNWELIVSDDCSTDDSLEIIRAFNDDRITLLTTETNLGGGTAYNKAYALCTGKYLCCLDSDDFMAPDKIEKQVRFLEEHSGVDVLGTFITEVDDEGNATGDKFKHEEWFNRNIDLNQPESWLWQNRLNHSSVLIRKSVHDLVGLINNNLVFYDYELWVRCLATKAVFRILPERLTYYRYHGVNVTHTDRRRLFLESVYIFHSILSPYLIELGRTDLVVDGIFDLPAHKLYCELGPTHRSRLLGGFMRDHQTIDFPEFLQDLGEQAEIKESIVSGLVDKFLSASEKQREWISEIERGKSWIEEQSIHLRQEVEAKDQEIVTKIKEVKQYFLSQIEGKDRVIEAKDREIALKEQEIVNIKSTKLQRLKHTVVFDNFSLRKLTKIIYLLIALATPQRIRQRLRPQVQKAKEFFNDLTDPKTKSIKQKLWGKRKPLVSVVIPCFNYGKYVEEAIDSVLAQTFQRFEIIVVDGGSTDDATISLLQSLQKPKTKIYFRKGRHLVGDNRNFGIRKAQGKYISCLDADDKLKPTYLEKALFLLEMYHYDIVSTSLQMFGNKEEVFYVPVKPRLDQIVKWNQITTVALFSKKLLKKAKGFKDVGIRSEHVHEDWDLWVRMMGLGARTINISEPLMLYRVGHTSLSTHSDIRPVDEHQKAIVAFNKKHLTPKSFRLAEKRNAIQFEVEDGYINLSRAYQNDSSKTRILFALPFVITGGADTVLLQLARHLTENDFDLFVVTTIKADNSFGDNTRRYESVSKGVYHLYDFLDDETKWKDFIFYLIESRKIDILFIVGSVYVYDILPEIKQRFPHVKIVDQLFNEFGHIENNRKQAQYIDANIVANETIKDVLVNQYGEEEKKVKVIIHGVDVDNEFNPVNIDSSELLASGVIPENKFIISFIGRFSEEKCPEMFVDIARALSSHENVYFLMIGNGPVYPRVKQCILEAGLGGRICAPGFVEDIKPFLKISDILAIPSKIEGIPIILMESLALGVPVIASSVGGIPSLIKDSFNGFVCNHSSTDEFVQRIRRLMSDRSLQTRLKVNAREYAQKNLSVEKMNNEYQRTFLNVLRT